MIADQHTGLVGDVFCADDGDLVAAPPEDAFAHVLDEFRRQPVSLFQILFSPHFGQMLAIKHPGGEEEKFQSDVDQCDQCS